MSPKRHSESLADYGKISAPFSATSFVLPQSVRRCPGFDNHCPESENRRPLFKSRCLATANNADAAARLGHLRDIPLLPRTPAASALTTHLLANGILPAVAADDAVHIGLAAAHGMDFLLTWNCRHINNHHNRARIERACAAFELAMPDICTPAELMSF